METIIKAKKDTEEIIKATVLFLFFSKFTSISTMEIIINMIEKVSKLRGRSQLKLVFIKKLITSVTVKIITGIATRVIDIGLLFIFLLFMFFSTNIIEIILFLAKWKTKRILKIRKK